MRRLFLCLICLTLPGFAAAQDAQEKPTLVLDAGGHTAAVNKVLFSSTVRLATRGFAASRFLKATCGIQETLWAGFGL